MPPTSSIRKGSAAPDSNRRQSGRQARTSTTRPLNYYARPYGSLSGPVDEPQSVDPPGFFPAITYFADAITALPKEVQRHVSLMKEVEAKVYGPTEALKSLTARIHQLPSPPPRHEEPSAQGLLSFTAANSTTASLNGSLINGTAPNLDLRVATDVLDGANSEVDEQADLTRRSHFRDLRHLISTMIVNLDEKNNVMAEANRALAQQLSRMDSVMPHVEGEISEEARLGSTTHWAYADNRVKKQTAPANDRARRDVAATSNLAAAAAAVHDSDIAAARGQATRESKKTRGNHHADSDFDDKPTTSTKRAAPAKARKETAEQKTTGLGITNGASAIAPAKRRKVEKATAPAMERSASGARKNAVQSNTTPRSTPQAEPIKQKKKPGPAPGFVPVKKRQQQALASGANSPKVASSPVLNTVQPDLSVVRPSSSRVRQNSSTSNLQYSLLAGGDKPQNSRPTSRAENRAANGANVNGNATAEQQKSTAQETKEDNRMQVEQSTPKPERTNSLKNEDVPMSDAPASDQPTRGRQLKVATPSLANLDGGTAMVRTRSNRGNASHAHNNQNPTSQPTSTPNPQSAPSIASSTRASQSRTPEAGAHRTYKHGGHGHSHHRKSGSGAHILKQIASFNRSPDMDRHRSIPGEPASDFSSSDELHNHARDSVRRRDGSGSLSGSQSGGNAGVRSSSRRSAQRGASAVVVSATSAPASVETGAGRASRASRQRGTETEPRSAQQSRSRNRTPEVAEDPGLSADEEAEPEPEEEVEEPVQEMEIEQEPAVQQVEDEDDEEEEEDPNEDKYCYCGQGSFGEMIACDNDECSMEWFHLQCTNLRSVPADNVKWYCDVCKEAMGHTGRGGKKGRPGSRHAGH